MDANFTRLMIRNEVATIKRWPAGRFSVELVDGRFGVGGSVGEALEKAQLGNENIRKAS